MYAYDGSVPVFLSDVFGDDIYKNAHAEQYEGKYYVSMKKGTNTALMVYDPVLQLWHKEDDTEMKLAAYGDGKLYYIDRENQLRTIADDGEKEVFDWTLESGDMMEGTFNMKHISKLMLHVHLDEGAVIGSLYEIRFGSDVEARIYIEEC